MKKLLVMSAALLFFGINAYAANGDLVVNGKLQVNGNLQYANGSTQTSAWLPAGTIIMYGGSTSPTGWLLADGSAVSRTTYSALFAAMGTTYGAGDGSTTFNLPDFRGLFPKGTGTTNRAAGKDASGNFYSGILGQYAQDKMQGHKHSVGTYYGGSGSGNAQGTPWNNLYATQYTGDPSNDGTNGIPRTAHTTEPQSLGVNFIIKY